MKPVFTIIALFLLIFNASAQQLTFQSDLDIAVKETSGLLYLNNTLITHNDSGNTNQLFDVDTSTGAITRSVTIANATNIDWEDLTQDGTYIYIGDIGNNEGDRTNIKVYRILISDYFSATTVTAEVINYSYNDQTDFSASPFATNYDAETLIHFNNQLYIFTKNWIDGKTNIYELSKTIGTHSATFIDTVDIGGLATGGSFNPISNTILICGYDLNGAFVVNLNGFSSGLFSNGNVSKTALTAPANYSTQIEGLIHTSETEYYISAEENAPEAQGLYSLNISTLSSTENEKQLVSFYPNPAKETVTINLDNYTTEIYSILGELVKFTTEKQINVSDLNKGIYLIKFIENGSSKLFTKRLVIQ